MTAGDTKGTEPQEANGSVPGSDGDQEAAEKNQKTFHFVIKSPPKASFIKAMHKLTKPFLNEVTWYSVSIDTEWSKGFKLSSSGPGQLIRRSDEVLEGQSKVWVRLTERLEPKLKGLTPEQPGSSKFAQIGLAGLASPNRVVIKMISNSQLGATGVCKYM